MAFTLTASVKDRFFDRAAVVASIKATERRALSRIGAFVRTRAQTDILRRNGSQRRKVGRDRRGRFRRVRQSAPPGSPPLIHSRSRYATLRNIQFGLGPEATSVVIGPIGIPSHRLTRSSATTVPELMEFGGTAQVVEHTFAGSDEPYPGESNDSDAVNVRRQARYTAHAFMGPALDKEVRAGTVLGAFATVRN